MSYDSHGQPHRCLTGTEQLQRHTPKETVVRGPDDRWFVASYQNSLFSLCLIVWCGVLSWQSELFGWGFEVSPPPRAVLRCISTTI